MTYPVSVRIQFFLYALGAIIIMSVDRITKLVALQLQTSHKVLPFLSYELVLNRGISWGMLHSTSPIIFFGVTSVIAIIIVGIVWHAIIRLHAGHWVWAEVCIISGAVSNLIDRFVYGGVVDFIHLSYAEWSFPVFNIADIAVVIGVALLLWEFYNE